MEFEHPKRRSQREEREKFLAGRQILNSWSREEMFEIYHAEGERKAKALCPSSLDTIDKHQVTKNEEVNGGDYALNHYRPIIKWGK